MLSQDLKIHLVVLYLIGIFLDGIKIHLLLETARTGWFSNSWHSLNNTHSDYSHLRIPQKPVQTIVHVSMHKTADTLQFVRGHSTVSTSGCLGHVPRRTYHHHALLIYRSDTVNGAVGALIVRFSVVGDFLLSVAIFIDSPAGEIGRSMD